MPEKAFQRLLPEAQNLRIQETQGQKKRCSWCNSYYRKWTW